MSNDISWNYPVVPISKSTIRELFGEMTIYLTEMHGLVIGSCAEMCYRSSMDDLSAFSNHYPTIVFVAESDFDSLSLDKSVFKRVGQSCYGRIFETMIPGKLLITTKDEIREMYFKIMREKGAKYIVVPSNEKKHVAINFVNSVDNGEWFGKVLGF